MNLTNTTIGAAIAALFHKFFPKTVDSAIKGIHDAVAHLEAAVVRHSDSAEIIWGAIDELYVEAGQHHEESNRAAAIAARLKALVA